MVGEGGCPWLPSSVVHGCCWLLLPAALPFSEAMSVDGPVEKNERYVKTVLVNLLGFSKPTISEVSHEY